jgi:hypothetical protein
MTTNLIPPDEPSRSNAPSVVERTCNRLVTPCVVLTQYFAVHYLPYIEDKTMTNSNKSVQIKINESNFLANLGAIFSNTGKVINELIQNASRANATTISFTTSVENGRANTSQFKVSIKGSQQVLKTSFQVNLSKSKIAQSVKVH